MVEDDYWSADKKAQFTSDFKKLMDTYGLVYVANLSADNTGNKFNIDTGNVYFYTSSARDERDAAEITLPMEMDEALDQRNYARCAEIFDKLGMVNSRYEDVSNKRCATCTRSLKDKPMRHRAYCGDEMCERCYAKGERYCLTCRRKGNTSIYWVE